MAQVVGEAGHLRVVGAADKKRGAAGEQDHRDDHPLPGDVAHGLHDVGQAAHRAWRRCHTLAKTRAVGRADHPDRKRQVEHGVEHDAVGRADPQHDQAADAGADQHAHHARAGVQAHRARQLFGLDDVVQQQLAGRLPQHAGEAVQHQQQHGVPGLERIGQEKPAPAERGRDEHAHADLDQAARVEAVGQRARQHREKQERQPVRDHREAGQGGRIELLVHHPIADHMLDVVGHHRHHVGDEMGAIARIAQGGEGLCGGCHVGAGHAIGGRCSAEEWGDCRMRGLAADACGLAAQRLASRL